VLWSVFHGRQYITIYVIQKRLASDCFLNHNKYNDRRDEAPPVLQIMGGGICDTFGSFLA
ncbi:hypothetical protein PUT90_28185, partial [Klebsiella pneumoniae]